MRIVLKLIMEDGLLPRKKNQASDTQALQQSQHGIEMDQETMDQFLKDYNKDSVTARTAKRDFEMRALDAGIN